MNNIRVRVKVNRSYKLLLVCNLLFNLLFNMSLLLDCFANQTKPTTDVKTTSDQVVNLENRESNSKSKSKSNSKEGKIQIVISVDWEGEDLKDANLKAFNNFREKYPQIKIQHFLNPVYFLRAEELALSEEEVNKKIRSVIREGDEEGLHLHAWRHIVEKSKVKFKDEFCNPVYPNFFDFFNSSKDGLFVPIWVYTKEELIKIIATSKEILMKQKFKEPKSFRAGGWMATSDVLYALAESGIKIDCSSIPSCYSLSGWDEGYLKKWVNQIWASIKPTEQPFIVGEGHQQIIELPNNGHLSDYVSAKQMLESFKNMVDELKKNPSKDIYLSLGFHQESAAEYLINLQEAIELIKEWALQNNVPYEFATFPLKGLIDAQTSKTLPSKQIIKADEMNMFPQ
ncbi:MAG: hypothetical protein HQK49_19090 [Oligoflexia bacterium]|nr:hypothetical protein [Oligoflexia bacterium]